MEPETNDAETDERVIRWLGAIVLLFVLHAGWMVFDSWYLHLGERGFLVGGCFEDEEFDPEKYGVFHFKSGPCPPDRPYADVVSWAVPILGLLVSSLLPPIRPQNTHDGWVF